MDRVWLYNVRSAGWLARASVEAHGDQWAEIRR